MKNPLTRRRFLAVTAMAVAGPALVREAVADAAEGPVMNPAIRQAVCEALGKADLSREDILSVTDLKLNGLELTDVSDLAQFDNLEKLELNDNLLTDLSPLSGLTRLRELRAGNDPFLPEEQKAARKGKNVIKDFSFLKDLKSLTHIGFTDTDLTGIGFVEMLPNLEHLWAYSNPLDDISPMGACKKLRKAYFYDCPVTDISVCGSMPQLEGIAINCTQVSDLSPLRECLGLTYLDAHDARISDVSPISDLVQMNYLTLEGNRLADITPLLGMQVMKWLTIGGNSGLSFDAMFSVVTQLRGLVELNTAGTDLTDDQKAALEKAMPWCKMKYAW
jgi:internalin A